MRHPEVAYHWGAMARVGPGKPLAEPENEETSAQAVKAVQRFRSHTILPTSPTQQLSIGAAGEARGIAASTLRIRLRRGFPCRTANVQQQFLTPTDEKAIVRLINTLERTGHRPRMGHVRKAAECIQCVGGFQLPVCRPRVP